MIKDSIVHIPDKLQDPDRETKKKQRGCVIRSLESAFNTSATEAEWNIRLRQTDQLRATTGRWRSMGQGPEREKLIAQEYLQDIENLQVLVLAFGRGSTELGNAIRNHQARLVTGNLGIIHRLLATGSKVLYIQPHHIMHIGRIPGTPYIYSVSDTGHKVYDLSPASSERDLLVFTPK